MARSFLGGAIFASVVLLAPASLHAQAPLSQYDWATRWTMNPIHNEAYLPFRSGVPGYPPRYSYAPAYAYSPAYSAATSPQALIEVHVPTVDTRVWFDNQPTRQQGLEREYASPALPPGRDFQYTVRARWLQNGQAVEQTEVVRFQAGDRVAVNFPRPR